MLILEFKIPTKYLLTIVILNIIWNPQICVHEHVHPLKIIARFPLLLQIYYEKKRAQAEDERRRREMSAGEKPLDPSMGGEKKTPLTLSPQSSKSGLTDKPKWYNNFLKHIFLKV